MGLKKNYFISANHIGTLKSLKSTVEQHLKKTNQYKPEEINLNTDNKTLFLTGMDSSFMSKILPKYSKCHFEEQDPAPGSNKCTEESKKYQVTVFNHGVVYSIQSALEAHWESKKNGDTGSIKTKGDSMIVECSGSEYFNSIMKQFKCRFFEI